MPIHPENISRTKIEVGQRWRTCGDEIAEITSQLPGSMYPFVGYISGNQWEWNADGENSSRLKGLQLVSLIGTHSSGDGTGRALPPIVMLDVHESAKQIAGLASMEIEGYESLAGVLREAYAQAAVGKGHERHANGEPFEKQVMADMARRFGTGALLGQAFKKSEESQRLDDDRAIKELLGAINYLAGAVIDIRRRRGAEGLS